MPDELEMLRKDLDHLNEGVARLFANRLLDSARVDVLISFVAQAQERIDKSQQNPLSPGTSISAPSLQDLIEKEAREKVKLALTSCSDENKEWAAKTWTLLNLSPENNG